MKHVLVPTDFEEASRTAIVVALELAERLNAEVTLAHVYRVPIYAYPSGEAVFAPGLRDDFERVARRSLEVVSSSYGIRHTLLREGDPASAILEIIREISPAMVVMGTHGRRGLARLLAGSVTEKVVRSSPVPVLTVHVRPTHRTAAA